MNMTPQQYTSFQVGDGASLRVGSDSYAYTVVSVTPSGKTVKLQKDTATLVKTSNPYVDQVYTYQADPDGVVITARLGKRGWKANGNRVAGYRREYQDPSF